MSIHILLFVDFLNLRTSLIVIGVSFFFNSSSVIGVSFSVVSRLVDFSELDFDAIKVDAIKKILSN